MVNINRRYNVFNARAFKARALFFFFTALRRRAEENTAHEY